MNWKTKIKFALDICCGVSYLYDCGVSQIKLIIKKVSFFIFIFFYSFYSLIKLYIKIFHKDIQPANILVNVDLKVKNGGCGFAEGTSSPSPPALCSLLFAF